MYSKSIALQVGNICIHFFIVDDSFLRQIWLLGYEITDTVCVVTKSRNVLFLTSQKKAQFLSPLLVKVNWKTTVVE